MKPSSPTSVCCSDLADIEFCIQGTALTKAQGLFPSVDIGFDLRVQQPDKSWVVRCTLRDVCKLHTNLSQKVADPAFINEIARLAYPKQPFFNRRDTFVIKGLCVELDHYMDELLRLCRRFTATGNNTADANIVEQYVREFFASSATVAATSPI
ncbi:Aste57867_3823 [Aphanomyces stellatus]|uniref:Aste57867_3823 protein n=1 Tax=Aphanomyces stellatus TaxID=120398 RepID=A0A485KBE3_9STRA|nr:hypothetical protein As57867_003812 [Aphanomyces stellatus]VFT80971.1 Aste57867_3823 [Aphanomyces stellatus]